MTQENMNNLEIRIISLSYQNIERRCTCIHPQKLEIALVSHGYQMWSLLEIAIITTDNLDLIRSIRQQLTIREKLPLID